MTFKLGDKVKYKGDCGTFSGALGGHQPAEGVVVEREGIAGVTSLRLTSRVERYPAGTVVNLFTRNLERIEKPFGFEDIQEGDTIRRTKVYTSGAKEVREGKVNQQGSAYWSQDSLIIAFKNEGEGVTYELLERPEPPHWTETKPVGSVALHNPPSGTLVKTLEKVEKDVWRVNYLCNNNRYTRTNSEMQEAFADCTPDNPEWRWIS